MKTITNLTIDSFDMPPTLTQRTLLIAGEVDAEFSLQIFNSSNQFYNFNTKTFAAGSKSFNTLNVKMKSNEFRSNIIFPANGSGTTYTILLIAKKNKNTELNFGYGKYSFSTNIIQNANAQLTFTVGTANSSTYTTFSQDITSSGPPNTSADVAKNLEWTLSNTEDNTNGFGLRLIRQPVETDWYYETTETVDGAVSSGTEVKVDDLTDLATGMHITGVSSGSLSGTPTITAINTVTKTLTISSAQTFADGITLTFQARGSSIIKKSINADIDFSSFNSNVISSVAAELSKTVRTTATGNTTIPLNGTFGISGGGHVTVSGRGIVNTSANTVQTVDPDEVAGSVVVQVNQSVKQGTKVYFTGSTQSIKIKNPIIIRSYPLSNKIIKLNLDNFITPGTET
jgi:hypothetical protein